MNIDLIHFLAVCSTAICTKLAIFEVVVRKLRMRTTFRISNSTGNDSMGTSLESRRTSAYSEDLKWRIVWQKEVLGFKCKDVAVNLGVDAATVSQTVARFRETGGVQRRDHPQESTESSQHPWKL